MGDLISSVNKHFSKRATKYNDNNGWVYDERILSSIKEFVESSKKTSICRIGEMGAGTCVVSNYLFENYANTSFAEYYAIDINERMLNECQNEAITKIVSPIEETPFSNSYFDILISRQCLHYVANVDVALQEMRRILKEDGVLIFAQIVPYDTESSEYWSKIVKIRQPLRQYYYDETQWDACMEKNGFSLCSTQKHVTVSSLSDWKKKYTIEDASRYKKMWELLCNAPDEYKRKYSIKVTEEEIISNAFWIVKKYCVS